MPFAQDPESEQNLCAVIEPSRGCNQAASATRGRIGQVSGSSTMISDWASTEGSFPYCRGVAGNCEVSSRQ
jgi:hypothetical protein